MAQSEKSYLLFDIDGTLIHAGGAGRRALTTALADAAVDEVHLQGISFAGRTDRQIIMAALRSASFAHNHLEDLLKEVEQNYLRNLDGILTRESPLRVYPFVQEFLRACTTRPDIELALLTGNMPDGARIKLQHGGLWDFFPWGVFGDWSENRVDLAREAYRRITSRANGLDPRSIFVIGDTTADVRCGQAIGATTVGLTSGFETEEMVRAANPDHLTDSFRSLFELWQLPPPAVSAGGFSLKLQ